MKIWGQIIFVLFTLGITIYHNYSHGESVFTIELLFYWALAWFLGRQYDKAKHFEKIARLSEKSYKNLLDSLPSTIIIHKDHRVIYVNDLAVTMFRAPNREALIGKPTLELVTPKYADQLKKRTKAASSGNKPLKSIEYKLKRQDGTTMDFEVSSLKIIFEGVDAVLSIGKDITEKNEQTDQLLQKSEKLALLGQMAAGIAHEIRNPLTSIRGFVQLFKGDQDQNVYYDIVLSELDRINNIVGEFLFLSKPTTTAMQERDVKKLLSDVVTLIQTQTILSNIQIGMEYESNLPYIYGDENQLKQVFLNILKNATEAMPNGGTIELKVKKDIEKGVLIQFTDQGVGIPKERIPTLGEPFYTTKEKGTGLGLMTCYKIIENHHGQLLIESEVNKGTTVQIILPFASEALKETGTSF
ncbi:ATP-binding protein [Robertmurraya korlensis]|uniref:ATP-binding protein n=1 Tax=Robertmurraya korlensis TaxID=519977 RepID=UPI002040CD90|nr:ATP-binding protein [Robertmurraya korlensis]MCM3600789.1 ATP-binding protein [Robertmurraya korlensis]